MWSPEQPKIIALSPKRKSKLRKYRRQMRLHLRPLRMILMKKRAWLNISGLMRAKEMLLLTCQKANFKSKSWASGVKSPWRRDILWSLKISGAKLMPLDTPSSYLNSQSQGYKPIAISLLSFGLNPPSLLS
jgi:hypothetical protein